MILSVYWIIIKYIQINNDEIKLIKIYFMPKELQFDSVLFKSKKKKNNIYFSSLENT